MSGRPRLQCPQGFTLIEVIVCLIVVGIVAAMVVQVVGTNVAHSSDPALMSRRTAALQKEMEEITAQYRRYVNGKKFALVDFLHHAVAGRKHLDSSLTGFVSFDSGSREIFRGLKTETHILQVTLKDGDQTLTCLFTD